MHGHYVIDPARHRVDDIVKVLGEIALPLIIGHGINPGHARFCQLLALMRDSMNAQITFGPRVKKSPYFDATVKAGVTHFSIYNHTFMPTSYGDVEGEYWRLIQGVSMWDVSCQAQLELRGPNASDLAQAVVTRDLTTTQIGQGKYAPMVDHAGRLLNDPLLLRVGDDRWWLSLADSDMLFWCQAIAAEQEMDVRTNIVDVAPLAVQGPLAQAVVADIFGDWVSDLRHFRYQEAEIDGISVWVGRAGWSKQGGFELYLQMPDRGTDLWNIVAEAGRPYQIGPGAPNAIERIESSLLSYGSDTDADSDPFECGIGRFVDLDSGVDFIGRPSLSEKRDAGLRRQLVGIFLDGDRMLFSEHPWPVRVGEKMVGSVRATAFSPRLERNIGLAILDVPHNDAGSTATADDPGGSRQIEVANLPFL